MRLLGAVVLVVLVGCATEPGAVREVTRQPGAAAAAQRRIELTQIVKLSGEAVDLVVPLLPTDEGLQVVETLKAQVAPMTSYEVTGDGRGNRVLRARWASSGEVEVRTVHVVTRHARAAADLSRVEDRPLTDEERRLLGVGAGDVTGGRVLTTEGSVEELVARGIPTRRVHGLRVSGDVRPIEWREVYVPGLSWVAVGLGAPGEVPLDVVVISRSGEALPRAMSGAIEVEVVWAVRGL